MVFTAGAAVWATGAIIIWCQAACLALPLWKDWPGSRTAGGVQELEGCLSPAGCGPGVPRGAPLTTSLLGLPTWPPSLSPKASLLLALAQAL